MSAQQESILIVDDEQHVLDSLSLTLQHKGQKQVLSCQSGGTVLALLKKHFCPVVLLDLSMPDISGEEILARICTQHPHVAVIIITGTNEVQTAVRCMQSGALDYLVKPVQADELLASVERALKHSALLLENMRLRSRLLQQTLQKPEAFEHILTCSRQMQAIFNYIEVIAPATDPLLITGETGTGKDLMAKALHLASPRSGNFVQVNTASLDEQMFADVLFGHIRGAFTDAKQARAGLVDQAYKGTLFLDEIGDLHPASQLKLLHLIQDQEYLPLGANTPKKAEVRIIAATNRDLPFRIKQGSFRQDLFYRLSTYQVSLPPLRERKKDIPLLATHFLEQAVQDLGLEDTELSDQILSLLQGYDFPGNIRELRSLIFDGLARGGIKGVEEKTDLLAGKEKQSTKTSATESADSPEIVFPYPLPNLEDTTRSLIREALSRTKNNQAKAAKMLGISKQALSQRLKKNQ